MSFHWSCFIVPSCLEICSFIIILVCLSLFHSVYAKTKKQKKTKRKEKKKKRKNIYINAHIYVFSISIPLVRMWIYEDHCL